MPKKSAHHRATETSTAQSTTVKPSDGPIQWDSSPNTLAIFAASLKKHITKHDPRFRSLIESGAVVTPRGDIFCVSENHIDRLANNLLGSGTFEAPNVVLKGDFTALPTSATSITSPSSGSGGSGGGGSGSTPSGPDFSENKNYKNNAVFVASVDTEMFEYIVDSRW